MIRQPPRSTQGVSSAASDVYKRQIAHSFIQKCYKFLGIWLFAVQFLEQALQYISIFVKLFFTFRFGIRNVFLFFFHFFSSIFQFFPFSFCFSFFLDIPYICFLNHSFLFFFQGFLFFPGCSNSFLLFFEVLSFVPCTLR
eukprot:TRINITY_DN25700_c0_g1_i2.p2 TRINITY_DN25700_c0_g1~~TRINITY_DN25700_c0_g1_i2.p2  ORF type:complete len:140 (+),score=4.02 TRINITY_DN25700_c0_g1_i2:127-546(+)